MCADHVTKGIYGPFDPRRRSGLFYYAPDVVFQDCTPIPGSVAFDTLLDFDRMPYGDGSVNAGFVPEDLRASFSRACAPFSYFEEPLKFPGSTEHFIPPEFERFIPVLRQIANYEFSRSVWAPYKRATLLLEHIIPRKDYPAGKWHQDQPEGSLTACHIYTVSDIYPSFVQIRPRPTDFGYDRHRLQPALPGEKNPAPGGNLTDYFRQIEPYEIVLMSGYNIHRADILPRGTERTLLRVIYEGIPKDVSILPSGLQDRLNQSLTRNTLNP